MMINILSIIMIGKPTAKIFSCGDAFVITSKEILTINSETTAGKAIRTAVEMMVLGSGQ